MPESKVTLWILVITERKGLKNGWFIVAVEAFMSIPTSSSLMVSIHVKATTRGYEIHQ
jgi:hypothetical protein